MRVGDHQHHPVESPVAEPVQELGPEHFVFGVANIEVQHFAVTVGPDPGGHDDIPRDNRHCQQRLWEGQLGGSTESRHVRRGDP